MLELSNNGADFVKISSTQLDSYGSLTGFYAVNIIPDIGSEEGGSPVLVQLSSRIYNRDFSVVYCRFGLSQVLAIFVNDTYMSCITPPGTGSVNFSLVLNEQSFLSEITFKYFSLPIISSITPSLAYPGTFITIHGYNFTSFSNCLFNFELVKSVFIHDKLLQCKVPDHISYSHHLGDAEFYFLNVTVVMRPSKENYNVENFEFLNLMTVAVSKQPIIRSISHDVLLYNSISSITITGNGFIPNATLCRTKVAELNDSVATTQLFVINSTLGYCEVQFQSPNVVSNHIYDMPVIFLSISNNRRDFSGVVRLNIFLPGSFASFYPITVSSLNFVLTIVGSQFITFSNQLRCNVGGILTQPKIVNDTHLLCGV